MTPAQSGPGGRPHTTQHAVVSGFGRVYQAAGDMIVYEGSEPYRLGDWPPKAAGTLAEATAWERPSALLRASNALVAFTGRTTERQQLREWRKPSDKPTVHLVHGPGGQGKTRLAAQVAAEWAAQGWVILGAYHRQDVQAPDSFTIPDLSGVAGVLVVVDYAERWDTADLLRLLRDVRTDTREITVRVLLLARPAGTWWQTVAYRIKHDLDLVPTHHELGPLEQDPELSRTDLFAAARDRFADLLDVPQAKHAPPPPALAAHEAYRLVLTVHMAALATVLSHDHPGRPPSDPVEVSAYLLNREHNHWQKLHTRKDPPLATTPHAMGQMVYTATLTGPLTHHGGITAVELAGIESREHPGQLLKDHSECYPPPASHAAAGQATVLEPLYPDRLGEDYLALLTPGHTGDFPADPWADKAPSRLLSPSQVPAPHPRPDGPLDMPAPKAPREWARYALTTLIEAAARWPHLARTQLYPLLKAQPHLALTAGGPALAGLAGLKDVEPALLEAIEALLPDRHIDLDIAAAAIAIRLAERRLAGTTDPAQRAHIHDTLAHRLFYAGQRDRALTEGRQAVNFYRELVVVNRDAYLPDLAMSLNNHASRLAQTGRRAEAVPVSQEALDFYRELVAVNRDAYLPDLALSLNNHASRLAQTGRRAEAVPVSQEALDFYRELVAVNRDAYLPNLAGSLNNHALLLAETGRRAEAMPVSQEALDFYRELVAVNRDAYLPNLAGSLNNHALLLAETGRRAEAMPVSQEALDFYRELVAVNRDAYLPDLAMSLNNHASRLAQTGRRAEAMPVSQEALDFYRQLVAVNRDAYLPDLAMSLNNHASLLAQTGRRAEAMPVSQEALDFYRELVAVNRDAYLPDLALSLNNHANRLAQTGRRAEAMPVSQEALDFYRELVAVNRDAYLPEFAQSVTMLGYVLVQDARWGEAIDPLVEALMAGQELPEYAKGIVGTVVDLLRRCFAADATEAMRAFRAITGQDVPDWMKEPPPAPEG